MESNMNNTGIKIALWRVNSDNPKSPILNGTVTIDGISHPISLWDNSMADNPKAPVLKGKLSKPSPKLETSSSLPF